MAFDLERWAEKVAEAARRGVQVERLWSEKLKADKEKAKTEAAAKK
jgi:hypothetical protein